MTPALSLHQLASLHSADDVEYAKIIHALWSAVNDHDYGKTRLDALEDEITDEVLTAITDARDAINTAITKKESLMVMAPAHTVLDLLAIGYELRFACVSRDGRPLPLPMDALSAVGHLPAFQNDPATSWRPIRDEEWFAPKGGRLRLADVPLEILAQFCSAS